MNTKQRSRLELGNNWWSRTLLLLFALFLLVTLLVSFSATKADLFILRAIPAYLGMVGNYWIVMILWKILQWIANGDFKNSKLESMSEQQRDSHHHKRAYTWVTFVAMPIILLLVFLVLSSI